MHSTNELAVNSTTAPEDNRPTKTRVRIRIPKQYQEEPVISRLISHHGVTVNIAAALLGANARDDGWFDLELIGTTRQLQSALTYLDEMDLEIWRKSDKEEEGW
ncbi:NIL domain-containing protein [Trichocoleus sp. FACHB-90]|uniref:NIL domain-containing protein n=1 Tax=Cyanophyceae TaxID=3028117 RepID=UPI0016897AE4|nr:NIL domain-containing protein [Trichocoleus sp. FACHB-90]MBD1927021.1 NIL domain-containing protein [Trichocoleus sp. FACHB-90]